MDNLKNKTWLKLLYIVVYAKKTLFWFFRSISLVFSWLFGLFHHTGGPKIYRLFLNLEKKLSLNHSSWSQKLLEFFGERRSLQITLLIIVVIIALPQSKIYSKNNTNIPGQNTLLYKIIGPGEEYSALEDTGVDISTLTVIKSDNWKDGAVVYQNTSAQPNTNIVTEENNLSIDGTTLISPTILPGTGQTNVLGSTSERSTPTTYTVQAGDTLGTIAKKFGLKIETILWANNLTLKSTLKLGNQLKILPTDGLTHKVKSGDNVGKIAKLYKSTNDSIIEANNLNKQGTNLKIGQELFIPNAVKPATVVIPRVNNQQTIPAKEVVRPEASIESPSNSGYLWPTGARRISQYFGFRHAGLDIAGPIGTPNYASRSGTVIKAQCGWNGGYGCMIVIDHGDGYRTLYGHNSQLLVSVGDFVEQGQTIALLGSTGRSTGPHLHFEIRYNNKPTNPLKYIR